MGMVARTSRSKRQAPALPPPPGLESATFAVDSQEYAVLAFPVPEHEAPDGLTEAERSVVHGVLEGMTNAEIAARRGTSPNTVANQLRSIYVKVRVRSRSELIKHCARRSKL